MKEQFVIFSIAAAVFTKGYNEICLGSYDNHGELHYAPFPIKNLKEEIVIY